MPARRRTAAQQKVLDDALDALEGLRNSGWSGCFSPASVKLDKVLLRAVHEGLHIRTVAKHLGVPYTNLNHDIRRRRRYVRALEGYEKGRTDFDNRSENGKRAATHRGYLAELASGWSPTGEARTDNFDPEELLAELAVARSKLLDSQREIESLHERLHVLKGDLAQRQKQLSGTDASVARITAERDNALAALVEAERDLARQGNNVTTALEERNEARAERDELIGAGCTPEQNALVLLDLYHRRAVAAEANCAILSALVSDARDVLRGQYEPVDCIAMVKRIDDEIGEDE